MSVTDLIEQSANTGPLYAPTPFWAEGAQRLVADITEGGIENFRAAGAPLNFFVPTYGFPGNSLPQDRLEALRGEMAQASSKQQAIVDQWISGYAHALADYRTFTAGARHSAPHLLRFSESNVGNPREHFEFGGRVYSRSALNYLHGLTFLGEYADLGACKTFLEIGGGFGTLGEILHKTQASGHYRYIDIDIPPTCQIADYYLKNACPEVSVLSSVDAARAATLQIEDLPGLSILPNWQIEALTGQVDVFFNFISFQEMEPEVVANYLSHVDRLAPKWVVLRNMREGKQKRTASNPVGVNTPILKAFYDDALPNYTMIASDDTVYGYTTADGFHSDLMIFERQA
jgi:putative sugar O-methyltransferase